MVDSNNLIKIASLGRANPDALQRMQIQYTEEMSGRNVSINKPGTPYANALELNAVLTAMQIRENIAQLSYIYPSLATNDDELSRHMSYKDYLNMFSKPGKATFVMALPFYEVQKNAIDTQDGSGSKKLTIPAQTSITVSDTVFTMQYPIDIIITNYGTVTVSYDVKKKSPIYTPSESKLKKTWINILNNVEYLFFEFDIYQMAVISQSTTISAIAGFKETYNYTDQFYFCRCYMKNTSDIWIEVQTTHSDVTYDSTTPTVVLSVDSLNKSLTVEIPQIYLSNGLMRNQIRVDIYTTKGNLELSLENFVSKSFIGNFKDPDRTISSDPLGFAGQMGLFTSILYFATSGLSGGSNALSFGERRNRVIHRSSNTEGVPTSDRQLSNMIKDSGFDKTNALDNVSNREFLATRTLPAPTVSLDNITATDTTAFSIGSIGSVVKLHSFNLGSLTRYKTVVDNGKRVTVLPNTLYKVENGLVTVVDKDYVDSLRNPSITSVDSLANIVNQSNFYYTPFFYVHDTSDSEYSVRAYRLDSPQITRKYALANNDTLGIAIAVSEYSAELMPDYSAWRFLFRITGSELLAQLDPSQVNIQLSYLDSASNFRTNFNGRLITSIDSKTGKPINGDYVFEVLIETNWDVNKDNRIRIGSGTSVVDLTADWDIVVFLKNYKPVGAISTTIDNVYNPAILPDYNPTATYIGVTQEQLTINLGYHMDKLWTRTTSTIEEWMYERYTVDVPAFYSKTIYETTPAGDVVLVPSEDGKRMVRVVKHAAGEPILDALGKPVYSHYRNEVVLDPITKEPILVEGERGILRNLDLILFDGKYYFATADNVINYRDSIPAKIEEWNNGVLTDLTNSLINDSKLFFHPKSSVGDIKAYVGDNLLVTLEADQHLTVTFIVNSQVYRNTSQRRNIKIKTITTIVDYFNNNKTISRSELVKAIRDQIGDEQLGIELKGLFKDEYEVVTIAYNSIGPSIGKRLITDTALNLSIEDSIDVEFERHLNKTLTA